MFLTTFAQLKFPSRIPLWDRSLRSHHVRHYFLSSIYFCYSAILFVIRVIVLHAKCAYNGDGDLIPWKLFRAFPCNVARENSNWSLSFLDISHGTYSTRIKWVTRSKKLVEPVPFFRTLFSFSPPLCALGKHCYLLRELASPVRFCYRNKLIPWRREHGPSRGEKKSLDCWDWNTLRVIVAEGVKKRQMSKRTCQILRLSVDISVLMPYSH